MSITKFNMWLDEVNEKRKEHWDKNFFVYFFKNAIVISTPDNLK